VAKSRGVKLGTFGKVLAKRNKERSRQFFKRLQPVLSQLQKKGFKTAQSIANELNRRKVRTYRKGSVWHIGMVYKLLNRMGT
jgi:hypothetical protein